MAIYMWRESVIQPPTNIQAIAVSNGIAISWTDPTDNIWDSSVLIRSTTATPTSPSDWTIIVTETTKDIYSTNWYVDTTITDWTTYYYNVIAIWVNWEEWVWTGTWAVTRWTQTISLWSASIWSSWYTVYSTNSPVWWVYTLTATENHSASKSLDVVIDGVSTRYSGWTYSPTYTFTVPNWSSSLSLRMYSSSTYTHSNITLIITSLS